MRHKQHKLCKILAFSVPPPKVQNAFKAILNNSTCTEWVLPVLEDLRSRKEQEGTTKLGITSTTLLSKFTFPQFENQSHSKSRKHEVGSEARLSEMGVPNWKVVVQKCSVLSP